MARKIGLVPVPPNEELGPFLDNLIVKDGGALAEHMEELSETVDDTITNDEPETFAYARMLNFLAKQAKSDLVHLCAAAMWQLDRLENQPEAQLHVLETDGNDDGAQIGTDDADGSGQ